MFLGTRQARGRSSLSSSLARAGAVVRIPQAPLPVGRRGEALRQGGLPGQRHHGEVSQASIPGTSQTGGGLGGAGLCGGNQAGRPGRAFGAFGRTGAFALRPASTRPAPCRAPGPESMRRSVHAPPHARARAPVKALGGARAAAAGG